MSTVSDHSCDSTQLINSQVITFSPLGTGSGDAQSDIEVLYYTIAGSVVANVSTVTEGCDDAFVVSNTKQWVDNGLTAEYCRAAVQICGGGRSVMFMFLIPLAMFQL